MLNVFLWLLTVEAIGLIAFPLTYFLLPRLADRGYSVSKPLGILLIGYLSWILSVLHIIPNVRLSLVGLLLAFGTLSGWYAWGRRRELRDFVVRERKALILGEAIFLVIFLGWTIYRAYDPAIDHTEQPMDFAFLNASMESRFGAPEDPWLRGESISYYYFGYWMMGAVSKIAGVASNFSYNLSLALIPAMASMGIAGLLLNVARSEWFRWRTAVTAAIGAVVLVGIVANLEGVLEFMRANGMGSQGFWDWVRIDGLDGASPAAADSWMPQEFWWWFRGTRVINTFAGEQSLDYTIQEFPFFSYMLGDLHPHVMSLPFSMLFMAFCWNLLKSPAHVWNARDVQGYAFILAIGLVLGGLAFTNMWDLPTFSALLLAVVAARTYSEHGGNIWTLIKGTVPLAAVVIGLAFLFFIPYYLTFNHSVTGIVAVAATTRPVHMLLVWGLYLALVTPFIVTSFIQTTVGDDWRRLTTYALLVGFLPFVVWVLVPGEATDGLLGRFGHILPFALLISAAVYSAMWTVKRSGPNGRAFVLLLSALGLILIMGPELLFIRDSFGNRMNTVFKLYYQAWYLLAVVGGFALCYWEPWTASKSSWLRLLTAIWTGVLVILVVGSLYYPPAAAASKGGPFDGATLDGLAYVATTRPAEYEAIKFLRREASRDAGIVEAVGEWFDSALISRSTGIPTVLNWPGHEGQWRGSTALFKGREQDVALIYQTLDAQEAANLLAKYDVDYVYIGPREKAKYGNDGLGKFESFMEQVFSQDDVIIYMVAP